MLIYIRQTQNITNINNTLLKEDDQVTMKSHPQKQLPVQIVPDGLNTLPPFSAVVSGPEIRTRVVC